MLSAKFFKSLLLLFCLVIPAREVLSLSAFIGLFSEGDLSGWEEETFSGNTLYQLVQDQHGQSLMASTSGSASGLFREINIDLTQTPYLNWSWKIENIYNGNDEQSKAGDDYPVRIFVVVSGGLFFWNTKALNYAWSSNQAEQTQWESAVTRNAMMLAIRSGDEEAGEWLKEKRNIREDFQKLFGVDVTSIDAIAIMSDSDNTGQSAVAYYGDIFFSDN
tara:strand:+ start:59147 stop:59803 length:657 start_codon:yes stop_codon:yes gene_type:complete